MKTIYKYALPKLGANAVDLPVGATVLHFGVQRDAFVLWCLVDSAAPSQTRFFGVYGTGHELPSAPLLGEHIGTASALGGEFIWHCFELRRPDDATN